MNYFLNRRIKYTGLLVLVALIFYFLDLYLFLSLKGPSLVTGWSLFALIVFLSMYNARKKLTVLPLGNASSWTQFHIYSAILSGFLFGIHIRFRIPSGPLETLLAGLFAATFLSGVAGLVLTRTFPRYLNGRGEKVIFERIPGFITKLREQAEALVLRSVVESDSTTIADHYNRRLRSFFSGPRNILAHLLRASRYLAVSTEELDELHNYLNDSERAIVAELKNLLRIKDELDFQYAGQGILKYWLFVHIPLTYGLLCFSVLHALVVHAFVGGS